MDMYKHHAVPNIVLRYSALLQSGLPMPPQQHTCGKCLAISTVCEREKMCAYRLSMSIRMCLCVRVPCARKPFKLLAFARANVLV